MSEPIALPPPPPEQPGRPLSLIPVGLKEAALDSPTFRATAVHFSDQVEIIEKWLDGYVRAISKLTHDISALEETFNNFLLRILPPVNVSEAVLDHDYTLLAMKRFGEGSRDSWSQIIFGVKRMDATIVEPIKSFLSGELRNFKDARRYLEQSQKTFDYTLARFASQPKTKEPSSLREEAFQVHQTRKAYLKASLDFCLLAPQLRYTLDRLLVKISSDQWKEMKRSREAGAMNFVKWDGEMQRVRGWSKEMETGEAVFRRELQMARRDISEAISQTLKPSRELEDYNLSTVAFLGSKGPSTVNIQSPDGEKAEKQSWLFLRTISGKPARTQWVRRWFYVKSGIFGWLVQGAISGGVEESEKIGVLLCNVKPAVQEDRRFCFEVKTKNQTILLQAETQQILMEWLKAFEVAKNKAIEASAKDRSSFNGGIDPAFAITPPLVPEFAAKANDGHGSDDFGVGGFDRTGTLPVPGPESAGIVSRSSFDTREPRRSVNNRDEDGGRDHSNRLMQKLDLHRQKGLNIEGQAAIPPPAPGGIASLVTASHHILPVYSTPVIAQFGLNASSRPQFVPSSHVVEPHKSPLAPSTLANPPAPTNLSKSAVIVSGERGIGVGQSDATGGMPGGMMANLWGSNNWGYINRLEAGEIKPNEVPRRSFSIVPSMLPEGGISTVINESRKEEFKISEQIQTAVNTSMEPVSAGPPIIHGHRKAASVDADSTVRRQNQVTPKAEVFPTNYPIELKTQEAQFRMLFPNVPREDKVLLVFRATWSPNEIQEFPGRVYVTQNDIYFYSHHMGLVLISGASLDSIIEVTAVPGKDCDFIFLHLRENSTRNGASKITIKTFLEPLRPLQSRLNYLIDITQAEDSMSLEEIINALLEMENEDHTRSPSMESWEDVPTSTPFDDGTALGKQKDRNMKSSLHIERGITTQPSKDISKFQLPTHPIIYEPADMQRKSVEQEFDTSAKALYHIMFGDKSVVFQLLYHGRRAQRIAQGPWTSTDGGPMRRDFSFQIDYMDMFHRARQANVVDYQVIDMANDHICYVVTDMKTPWHLPHDQNFMLVSKIVITHVAKSKCKLAIYTKVEWSKAPKLSKGLVERQALDDCDLDAVELASVITDQVLRLGPHSRTKRAIHIFGHIGQQTSVSLFSAPESSQSKRPQIKKRTLTKMITEILGSFFESAITSVMMAIFAVLRSVWNACTANRFILAGLFLSLITNAFFTSKNTSSWWSERNAATFMTRIGVGPNTMMSRAIYLSDLGDALVPWHGEYAESGNNCFMQFQDIVNVTDMDSVNEPGKTSFSEKAARSTAARLRRTRQHLGSYRHDLAVAMRVVNNIEREMIQAEWENWLLDENMRCDKLQQMLQEHPTNGDATGDIQHVLTDKERGRNDRLDSLKRWQEEYCQSCKLAQQRVSAGQKHIAF